jgi:8-oxo-dGTP diphosphatase
VAQHAETSRDAAGRSYPPGLPKHSVSVGAAIIDDRGRFLAIQRRDTGEWVIPGGIVELDENLLDALRREVLEETGLEIEPEILTGVYKNMRLGVVSLVFRCHPIGGTLHETAEARDMAWLTENEIPDRMIESFATRLIDANASDGPKIRAHDGAHFLPDKRGCSSSNQDRGDNPCVRGKHAR